MADSTARKHIGPDGKPGTQCIQVKADMEHNDAEHQEPAIIDLHLRSALMLFPHRKPTSNEEETLPHYILTNP